jgi:hypothetical protein
MKLPSFAVVSRLTCDGAAPAFAATQRESLHKREWDEVAALAWAHEDGRRPARDVVARRVRQADEQEERQAVRQVVDQHLRGKIHRVGPNPGRPLRV